MNAMIMKEMAKDEMKDNPFAALGAAFGGVMVDKMVEAYVTPTGITGLIGRRRAKAHRRRRVDWKFGAKAPIRRLNVI